MVKKNNRPVFKCKVYSCFQCCSTDTVALAKESNLIIWCACGVVTAVIDDDVKETEKEIFNFIEVKPYFATKRG